MKVKHCICKIAFRIFDTIFELSIGENKHSFWSMKLSNCPGLIKYVLYYHLCTLSCLTDSKIWFLICDSGNNIICPDTCSSDCEI